MKLRTKYILLIVILHLVALVLSYFIFSENKILFIVSEVFIIISIAVSWQLYNELIRPLKLLMQGTEAIKDKDFNVKFQSTGKYEMDQLIDVYNRMMDELRTERIRQEQQHMFLEKLIHTSPTGILILDYDENVQLANPRALQLLNIPKEELIRKSMALLPHPVMQEIKQLQSGTAATFTWNGATIYKLQKSQFIDRGFPRHFIMIDELSAEILAAEKKAYGKVIRMMAHEVNNTIGSVNSIMTSALQKETLWRDDGARILQTALQVAVDRNQNLNTFMRNFADVVRLPAPQKRNINLHKILQSVTKLMEMKAGEKQIRFEYDYVEDPFYISADEQQMEQVLINIVKNGIEAIDQIGSIIFIVNPAANELRIADTGTGISAETESQLFSPFFSTKKEGQGIGLTLVKEILLNHDFGFSLQSVGEGRTEFLIQFSK